MKHFLTGFPLFAFLIFSKAQVSIKLSVPPIVPNSEVTLEIKINKGAVTNFAKYQIDVPPGVYLSEGDNKTGSFSFENNRAKVIWVSIPTEPEFTITMRLNPGAATGPGNITQKFYYLENGARKEVEAAPLTVNFSGGPAVSSINSSPGLAVSIQDATAPEALPPQVAEPPTAPETSTGTAGNTIAELTTNTPPVVETEKPVAPVKESSEESIRKLKEQFDATSGKTEPAPPAAAKTIPPAAVAADAGTNSISYKVQLGAYGENPGMTRYASLKGVKIVKEENFYKVLVGNFKSREEAVQKKDELLTKGFKGFVVTYQNGARLK
ncbi:MAG: SPOR domain-containing protein [Bacteroidota bacterium]